MSECFVPRTRNRLVYFGQLAGVSLGIGMTILWAVFLVWLILCALSPII
jgi:hypothetical protein